MVLVTGDDFNTRASVSLPHKALKIADKSG
jgi:hypothetical protein